jgi:hypothetical protein
MGFAILAIVWWVLASAKTRPANPNIATIIINVIQRRERFPLGRQRGLLTSSDMNAPSWPLS